MRLLILTLTLSLFPLATWSEDLKSIPKSGQNFEEIAEAAEKKSQRIRDISWFAYFTNALDDTHEAEFTDIDHVSGFCDYMASIDGMYGYHYNNSEIDLLVKTFLSKCGRDAYPQSVKDLVQLIQDFRKASVPLINQLVSEVNSDLEPLPYVKELKN